MVRQVRYFATDFETTVYEGQTETEVWASAAVELDVGGRIGDGQVRIWNDIDKMFRYFFGCRSNVIAYFHNLKFDGSFIIAYLMQKLKYEQAYNVLGKESFLNGQPRRVEWKEDKDMPNNSFKYVISNMGQWYSIKIKKGGYLIEFRDSLKLLPFSVREIGNAFQTKHRKLEMEYVGLRHAGGNITDDERAYIANDVMVMKEALEIMFAEGHTSMTIGSCCMKEFKKLLPAAYEYNELFPSMKAVELDKNVYGDESAEDWIRKSYKGGWCYLVKGKENKIYRKGITADVNSLYPSMMHSESGNYYPYGSPIFWNGNFIPDAALCKDEDGNPHYYFIRIRTRFYLKKNKLPFIQIKNNLHYQSNEMLETSDVRDPKTGKYYDRYIDRYGNVKMANVELTLTCTDYELLKEHYELVDVEILGGCWFYTKIGLFDKYIDKYKKIKQESKGAKRTLAKLFLNNLYGKTAASDCSSFKVAYEKENGVLGFTLVDEHNKETGYIPVGSAITSYARNFTIRAAQQNYYGKDKRGFIYADTDSIHCDLAPDEIKGIKVDTKAFCCWDLESCWDIATFTRQKTYIEHVTTEELEPAEKPYYLIKCAGMNEKCKKLFDLSLRDWQGKEENLTEEEKKFVNKLTDEEYAFTLQKRELTDFKVGLKVPGKLMSRRIKGGIVLFDTYFEMRNSIFGRI